MPVSRISDIIGIAVGYLLAALVRYIGKSRFWSRVAKNAERYLKDPTIPIDTPVEAAERALIDEQQPRVVSIARTISKSIPPRSRTPTMRVPVLTDADDTPKDGVKKQ